MDKKFTNAIVLSEDVQQPGMVQDFLYADYRKGYKSKNNEKVIRMNRKQQIADRVWAAMFGNQKVAML